MIQEANDTRPVLTVRDVMDMRSCSKSAARRMLATLEDSGLKRKGIGRGTHYSRAEFMRLWEKMDTRR